MASATDTESQVLEALNAKGEIADTEVFCRDASPALDHQSVVGVLRSLEAAEMVITEVGFIGKPLGSMDSPVLPACTGSSIAIALLTTAYD